MLKRFLEATDWTMKNPEKMTGDVLRRFETLSEQFDAWVARLPAHDQNCVESTIQAVRMVLQVFPKAKILSSQE